MEHALDSKFKSKRHNPAFYIVLFFTHLLRAVIMAIKKNITEVFLESMEEIEKHLIDLQFKSKPFDKSGLAFFLLYEKGNTLVEFLFGPSDWDVEMIIVTIKGRFAFRDLLEIPSISKWVNDNRYRQENGRNIKNELLWSVELLKFSLPFVE